MALYIVRSSFFCRPNFEVVVALIALFAFLALVLVFFMCSAYVSEWSRVTPKSLTELVVGMVSPSRMMLSVLFHSLFHVLNSVALHLVVDTKSCLSCRYGAMTWRYRFIRSTALFMSVSELKSVMSSAYITTWMLSGGVEKSRRYQANRTGDITAPWGTPVFSLAAFDCSPLKWVRCSLPRR